MGMPSGQSGTTGTQQSGFGNIMPLLQMFMQARQQNGGQTMGKGGAQRARPNVGAGQFINGTAPTMFGGSSMPRPQMPAPTPFVPVQQPPARIVAPPPPPPVPAAAPAPVWASGPGQILAGPGAMSYTDFYGGGNGA